MTLENNPEQDMTEWTVQILAPLHGASMGEDGLEGLWDVEVKIPKKISLLMSQMKEDCIEKEEEEEEEEEEDE